MAADPRPPGRLYLGVSPALLYRSDDGGKTWTACESVRRIPGYERWTFPPPPHIPHVRSIAPDPRTVGAVYIGVEEGGVYRSPDGGETWESLNEGLYWDVHAVLPAPDGRRLFATTGEGFYRSADGGQSWQHAMGGLDRRYTVSLALSSARPERLYVAAAATPPPGWREGANAALYASDDAGARWQQLRGGLPERLDDMVSALVAGEDEACTRRRAARSTGAATGVRPGSAWPRACPACAPCYWLPEGGLTAANRTGGRVDDTTTRVLAR